MSRKELENLSVKELAAICKERGIVHYRGKNRFGKAELVEAILEAGEESQVEQPEQNAQREEKIGGITRAVAKEKETAGGQKPSRSNQEQYLMNITVGTIVAFKEPSGKANTAAVQNVSFKRRQLKLATQYGKEFIVSFDDVLWVKTTKRWPSFVFKMLKEKSNVEDVIK